MPRAANLPPPGFRVATPPAVTTTFYDRRLWPLCQKDVGDRARRVNMAGRVAWQTINRSVTRGALWHRPCSVVESGMGRALAAWLLVGSALAAPPATPREVVESAVTRVVSELQDANLNARATEQAHRVAVRRRAEITRVAADLFDFEEVARLTLPRYWAVRTPEERAEFVRLFTQLLQRSEEHTSELQSRPHLVCRLLLGQTN